MLSADHFASFMHGFIEAHPDAPTPEQWAVIKANLAKVEAAAPALFYGHVNLERSPTYVPRFIGGYAPMFGTISCTN